MARTLLTSKFTNIDALSSYGETPLMLASHIGSIHLVTLLLDAKANPNIISLDGRTALHKAVNYSKSDDVVEKLAPLYTMYSQFDQNGDTPLHIAVLKQKVSMVEILLNSGFPINEPNSSGDIPIMQCCRNFEDTIFAMLLQEGADYDFKDTNGDTLLHNIVYMADTYSLISFFDIIKKYVGNTMTKYVNRTNNDGITPLSIAVSEKYDVLIPILMKHKSLKMFMNAHH
jgi:serine/threonine-protein phosphatase 6 regulatory ankyrin repeat subunit B